MCARRGRRGARPKAKRANSAVARAFGVGLLVGSAWGVRLVRSYVFVTVHDGPLLVNGAASVRAVRPKPCLL